MENMLNSVQKTQQTLRAQKIVPLQIRDGLGFRIITPLLGLPILINT